MTHLPKTLFAFFRHFIKKYWVGILIIAPFAVLALLSYPASGNGSWGDFRFDILGWLFFVAGGTMRWWATLYIGGRFLLWVIGVAVVLCSIIFMADSVELLRRASGNPAATFGIVLTMAVFKLPSTAQEVMPFGLLAATLGCLTQLTRTSELIIVRVSGSSRESASPVNDRARARQSR